MTTMRKHGRKPIMEPTPPKSLLAVLARLKPIDEDFPATSDQPPWPRQILMGVRSVHQFSISCPA